jgi:hypothetical protein
MAGGAGAVHWTPRDHGPRSEHFATSHGVKVLTARAEPRPSNVTALLPERNYGRVKQQDETETEPPAVHLLQTKCISGFLWCILRVESLARLLLAIMVSCMRTCRMVFVPQKRYNNADLVPILLRMLRLEISPSGASLADDGNLSYVGACGSRKDFARCEFQQRCPFANQGKSAPS